MNDRTDQPPESAVAGASGAASPFTIVGIGASAGGLEAFTQLLKNLPLDTGMGFVLVQHLDPEHESALTQILSRATALPVNEITADQRVEPDHVYVIPPDTNLAIEQGVLKLSPRQHTRAPHRPIDSFFASLAGDQHDHAIGVVLSGTANDGTQGLESIKAEGGITFAQDESARYDSMPRSAVAAGCVDLVLAPAEIASELTRIARHPYTNAQPYVHAGVARDERAEDDRAEASAHQNDSTALPSGGPARDAPPEKKSQGNTMPRAPDERPAAKARAPGDDELALEAENGYKRILLVLRNHTGVDFSLYKSTTIQRRISRRMILTKHNDLTEYAGFLKDNPAELDALYSDVLISVTSFFRNPEMFDMLQRTVLPELLSRRSDDPIRCWVMGCSTGQEAYSIAMSFMEAAEKAPRTRNLQIFATDLNEALLEKARQGLYSRNLAGDISPERLRRFFVEEQSGYRITKTLREMVVFARQNLISDPPFSRMDLISCRNLLIYLEPGLQKKALPTFHYALRPGGYLLLGVSESIGPFSDLFEPVDKKYKIYTRKSAPTPSFYLPLRKEPGEHATGHRPRATMRSPEPATVREGFRGELNAQREADRVSVNRFAPPGVLVNDELQILQFRGPTGAYLEPPAGKATFDVLKMAREGLMLPLRTTIQQAREQNTIARRENVHIRRDGENRTITLEVVPLKNLAERCFLILFKDGDESAREPAFEEKAAPPVNQAEEQGRIAELETGLAETREYLASIQEQNAAASQELQTANEEAQSANEELQSINEELETSKEELESSNEELTTVNEEMSHRNLELNHLNNDLVNLQAATNLAVILLGRDLAIRRFSPQAEKLFDLLATDMGRPVSRVRHGLVRGSPAGSVNSIEGAARAGEAPVDLETIAAEVIDTVGEQQCEVRDRAGRWYSLRVRPYITLDNRVDGALILVVDIDALKRTEQIADMAREYAENIIATVREPLLVIDREMRIETANRSYYKMFQSVPGETVGKVLFELGNRQWDNPRLRELLDSVNHEGATLEDFVVEHDFETIGSRVMQLNARRLVDPSGKSERILLAIEDVTARRRGEESRNQMENQIKQQAMQLADESRRKDEFLAMLSHELRNPLAPIAAATFLLRRHARDDEDPIQRQAREIIERQLANLSKLVNDLMEVSRITSGRIRLNMEAVDIRGVLSHAVETVQPLIKKHGHVLLPVMCPVAAWVNVDATRMEEVFVNLLNNAAKYTPDGGRIEIGCELQPGTNMVRISVRDNGTGIDPVLMPRIFDLFTQADGSLARSAGGLGIGLSLVHRLVELHGGTIDVHSPPEGANVGSEFIVNLHLVDAPQKMAPRESPVDEARLDPKGARVLVVDDNADLVTALADSLRGNGYSVESAHNGPDGLALARQWRPDVVVLDIGLPGMNGYDVAVHLRGDAVAGHAGARMKLIALTGYGRDTDIARANEVGFDAHLVKPCNFDELEKLIVSP